MRRLSVLLPVLLGLLLTVACGGEQARDAGALAAEADALFAEGEAAWHAARDAATPVAAEEARAEAARTWHEAGRRYRDVFRLLDPTPEASGRRALVAFRVARAFAKAAEVGTDPRMSDYRADTALLWLDQAERLAPEMRQVWYERGVLRDGEIEAARNPLRARAAFARYLEMVALVEAPPEAELPRIEHARARLEALAPPPEDDR